MLGGMPVDPAALTRKLKAFLPFFPAEDVGVGTRFGLMSYVAPDGSGLLLPADEVAPQTRVVDTDQAVAVFRALWVQAAGRARKEALEERERGPNRPRR